MSPVSNMFDLYEAGWTAVTNKAQLWRFMSGDYKADFCITPGDKYLSFHTTNSGFVGCRDDEAKTLTNHGPCIRGWERFQPIFTVGDNTVALKTYHRTYWSASSDGKLTAHKTDIGASEKFTIIISPEHDELILLTCDGGTLVSSNTDGMMYATGDINNMTDNEKFRGWRTGTMKDWAPVDKWEVVYTHENPNWNWKASNVSVPFRTTVGTSILDPSKYMAQAQPSVKFEVCPTFLRNAFATNLKGSTIFDWTSTSARTWEKEMGVNRTQLVEKSIKVEQVVGRYGPYVVRSDHFRITEVKSF